MCIRDSSEWMNEAGISFCRLSYATALPRNPPRYDARSVSKASVSRPEPPIRAKIEYNRRFGKMRASGGGQTGAAGAFRVSPSMDLQVSVSYTHLTLPTSDLV